MMNFVLLFVVCFTVAIHGLEQRSQLQSQVNGRVPQTNAQGPNINKESGRNSVTESNIEPRNLDATAKDVVSVYAIPDRKPLDNGNSGSLASVTVEAVLDANSFAEQGTPDDAINEGVSASKSIRSQPLNEGRSASKGIRVQSLNEKIEGDISSKNSRIEPLNAVSNMTSSKEIRLEPLNEGLSASKNVRKEPIVSASKSMRVEGSASKSVRVQPLNENISVSKDTRVEPMNAGNSGISTSKNIRTEPLMEGTSASKSTRVEPLIGGISASKNIRVEPLNKGVSATKDIKVESLNEGASASKSIRVESLNAGSEGSKSTRVEPLQVGTSVSKDIRVELLNGMDGSGIASKNIRVESLSEPKNNHMQPLQQIFDVHDLELAIDTNQYGPFSCTAWCVASCVDKNFGTLEKCQTSCLDFTQYVKCAVNDVECWKTCDGLIINANSVRLSVPNIFYTGYVRDPSFDPLSISIDWDKIPEAVAYVVEFIPTLESEAAGATGLKDIVDHPWYIFKKDDLCHEYFTRVAAVNSDGVGPFNPAVLIKAADPQLSEDLTFTVLETIIEDGPSKIAVVRIAFNMLPGLNPNDYAINGRVVATQCKNPVNELFIRVDTTMDVETYYPLVHIEKSLTNYEMAISFPEEIFAADCLYSFQATSIVTRCGSTVDGLGESATSEQFRIDPTNLSSNTQTESSPLMMQQKTEQLPPICQMTGYDTKVLNNNNDGKMDIVLSWDALSDGIHNTYLVHHWSSERESTSLVPKPGSEEQMTLFDTGDSKIVFYLPKPLADNDLHMFQICSVANEFDANIGWETVDPYIVDMASFKQNFPSQGEALSKEISLNERKTTWLIFTSVALIMCSTFIITLVIARRVKCSRRKERDNFTKIYALPDNCINESKTKLSSVQNSSFANPMV